MWISALVSLFTGWLVLTGQVAAQVDPSVAGRWSMVADLPFFPVHVHVLPTGKVMIWSGDLHGTGGGASGNDVRLWDPATGTTTVASSPGFDVFCSGHSFLADGRLFVAGGHIQNAVGLPDATTYDPFADRWTSVPDMNAGRWYPTSTTLANGDVLVVSGNIDTAVGENRLPAVFEVQSDTWRDLTSAQISLDLYPRMHLAPNGKVFYSAPSTLTRYLDTSGTGSWSVVANRSSNIYRDYGSSVMYEDGKVLVFGGSDPPTKTAEVIDLNASAPNWRSVSPMAFARRQQNATLLPDGKVLVTGGTSGPGFNNANTPVFAAEMWDPITESWTTMASAQIPRIYHSSAVLLPDGRILTTGGNSITQAEIYEPPYLFKGTRPTIATVPASVSYGQTFLVETPDATSTAQVTWIALSSTTHAFDMNQRINRLSFSPAAGGLNAVAPSSPNLAPPGYYMLFIVNANGVPSVAKIIQLTPSSSHTAPTLSSVSPSRAARGGAAFTLTVNGSNFVSGSVVRWNGSPRPTTFVSATQLTAAIPASDLAAAGTAQITVVIPAPGASSNALAFTVDALSASPATVPAGSSVTAEWNCIANPTPRDWIGLYAPGASNGAFIDWIYVSCSKTPGVARASGSCAFRLPSSLALGGFELRLFANEGFTLLGTSNVFTVSRSATLTLSPNHAPVGGTLTATWSGIASPTGSDWIGLFLPGGGDSAYIDWIYVSCSKDAGAARASGSCPFTLPNSLAPGAYQLRLFANNGSTLLAGSDAFTVGSASAGTLQLDVSNYSMPEDGGSATITITRTDGSAGAVGVTFSTSNGSATAPSDYTGVTQTVSFINGDTASKTISIPIIDDGAVEGSETISLSLSSPTGGASLGSPSTAVLTITDNDTGAAGTLQLSASSYNVEENGGSATIMITRTGGSTGAVEVTFSTSDGSATAPADYTTVSHTISFANGDTADKTLSVPIIDDGIVEGNETINLALSNPIGGASLGTPSSATLTITDNDTAAPSIAATPATVSAGATLTVNWNGITAPSPSDWIGFYAPSAANTAFIDWIYVSCSKTAAAARASGSCSFTLPASLSPGTYELRLLANDGFTGIAASNSVTVFAPAGPSLTASPSTVSRAATTTATWSGITASSARDWIGLYTPGATNTAFIDWIYVSCSQTAAMARASGSCSFTVPASIAPGTYQLRLLADDGFNLLATGNQFAVQ